MSSDTAARYLQALTDLRAARQQLVDAHVPMETNGRPPRWSTPHHEAVRRYSRAWEELIRAQQAHAEMPSR